MEPLMINYGQEIGIYSKKSQMFLRYEPETKKIKADSIHPFLKSTSRDANDICYEEFRIYNERDPQSRGPISLGAHILLINRAGFYMTVDEQGNVQGLKIPDNQSPSTYLRYSTWSLQPGGSPQASRKHLLCTDSLLFKSPMGNYLKMEDSGNIKADGAGHTESRSVWFICRARVPFIPNWARIKPFISASYLIPALSDDQATEQISGRKGRDQRMSSASGQEKILIGELLYALLSVEGKYIKRKEDVNNNRYYYTVDQDSQLDSSLVLMVSKILPLCEYHDRIMIFIQKYSGFEGGVIFQALANAVKSIRRDYIVAINTLDQEYQKGSLSLQRVWYETQKPQKSMLISPSLRNPLQNSSSY